MKLSELRSALEGLDQVRFVLPDGRKVPAHFHLTELGLLEKHFIDCGGTIRREAAVSLQLYTALDFHHRLKPGKFRAIIERSAEKLGLEDLEIEVEYQGETIGKYGLAFDGQQFQLTPKQTDCRAKEACDIPGVAAVVSLANRVGGVGCCGKEAGC